MGKLMKAFGKGTSAACVEDCDDSDGDPFVPNDFAEDDPFQASEEGQMDDPDLEKALYEFYVSHITNAGARNVKRKRSSDFPVATTFTRYSGKLFSTVIEIQIRKKFIPIPKYVKHDILDLPVDGEPIMSDAEAGREFILSHFNVTSIPPVSFFCNTLKSEELPDEDTFICFMCIALSTFLCPNSSLSPSPKYLHIFRDCSSVMNYDLSRLVYESLLGNIKKFKDSMKVASMRSMTFGGCHYAFVVDFTV
ncbi:hypothetical protein VPH35_009611 [Triticum aestivum]